MSPTQLFAFATDSIVVNGNQQPVMLYAYAEEEDEKAGRTRQQLSISNFIQKADDKRLRYQTNLQGNMQDLLSDLILSFGRPLTNFDSTKLQLTIGEFKPVYYQFEADSLNKNFTFKTRWIPDSTYNLIIGQDVGEDSLGNKLTKTDTLSFRTEMESAYGSLRIKFTNFNPSAKQVLQLVSNNVVAYSIPITSGEYFAPLFKPGDYEIRILNDSNGNGIWDPGKFFGEYRQPEIVVSFEKKLTVRANWENETTIEL